MSTTSSPTLSTHKDFYGDDFYKAQLAESELSAHHYLTHLWTLFQPETVLDIGCGRGAWLKTAAELGAKRVVGYDGPWNDATKMIDARILFNPVNLDRPFETERAQLAMTLEVAEHLAPSSSDSFISSLTASSDAIVFAAAYTDQGGTNHINERPHSFWATKFNALGFDAYDVFRPKFWGNSEVCFWYRQNTFLYLRRDTSVRQHFNALGFAPVIDNAFLNCVHPEMFHRVPVVRAEPGLRAWMRELGPSIRRSLGYRLRHTKPAKSA